MTFLEEIGARMQAARMASINRTLELRAINAKISVESVVAIEAGRATPELAWAYAHAQGWTLGHGVYIELSGGRIPEKASPGSAGYDLYSTDSYAIGAGDKALIKLGFRTLFAPDRVAIIRDRSGLALKRNLSTRGRVIDSDYADEWGVILRNESASGSELIEPGDRIAQVCFHFLAPTEIITCSDVPAGGRGGGFGSTGR